MKRFALIETLSIALLVVALSGGQAQPGLGAAAESGSRSGKADLLHVSPDKIVDLTHDLAAGAPEFHGRTDAFQYKKQFTIEKEGFAAGIFTSPEHYGTHIDAPAHFSAAGKTIDQIPAGKLILPCVVLDVRPEVEHDPDYSLSMEKLNAFEAAGKIPEGAAVLLLSGWGDRWNNPASYRNADEKGIMHFPGFSAEAAEFLMNKRHVTCLGIDTLSLDHGSSNDFPVHNHELAGGLFFIENLDNLKALPARGALLICAPLRIKDGTGSPDRIMAVLP